MRTLLSSSLVKQKSGVAIVVSSSQEMLSCIEKELKHNSDIDMLAAKKESQIYDFLADETISYIMIDTDFVDTSCENLIRSLRTELGEKRLPIILLASTEDEELLSSCISAGCDDVVFKPFTSLSIKTRVTLLEQKAELNRLYDEAVEEQLLAEQILADAINERTLQFEEIGFLSRSKSIFSGDLFLTARHPDGSLNILLADFTGHGLTAAIAALPVADTFSVMTEKGFELGYILENINSKLHTLLPTSMFMACSALNISENLKHVQVWNGGMPDIYLRDAKTGQIKHKIVSLHVPLGIIETITNQFTPQAIDVASGDQIIMFTDGLSEAINVNKEMYGEPRLEQCLRNNLEDKSIFLALVNDFNEFCGDIDPLDDVTLACIPCTENIMYVKNIDISKGMQITCNRSNNWCWYMELGGSSLRELNPVPMVIDEIYNLSGYSFSTEKLSGILSVLYENVIEGGGADDDILNTCNEHIINHDAYIRLGIKRVNYNGQSSLLIQMEDSGKEITHEKINSLLSYIDNPAMESFNKASPLVYELNKLSGENRRGNFLEAIIRDQSQGV